MTTPKRPTLKLSKPVTVRVPTLIVDYRVVWNEAASQWDIKRNGVDTKASRRKRQSAIDLAIRQAKTEAGANAKVTVSSVEATKTKTEWTSEGDAKPRSS